MFQSSGALSFPDSILPNLLTLDDGINEANLTLMGVASGPALQPVSFESSMEADGDKSPQPVLTQLNNSDFKFGQIDFRAEFISQPISLAEFNLGGLDLETSLSVNLPSFSDTYTKPVITTIEPRMFGAEAEYENRLRQRHASKQQAAGSFTAETIRIVHSHGEDSREVSPAPSLSLLPNLHSSIETFLSSQETSLSESETSSYTKADTLPSHSPMYAKQESSPMYAKQESSPMYATKHDLPDPFSKPDLSDPSSPSSLFNTTTSFGSGDSGLGDFIVPCTNKAEANIDNLDEMNMSM